MHALRRSRLVPKWLLVFAALLIAAGDVCAFSDAAHGSAMPPGHESDRSGEQHQHGVAHLGSCEGAVISGGSAPVIGHETTQLVPVLEAFPELRHARAVTVDGATVSRAGPPLYLLHAALLI